MYLELTSVHVLIAYCHCFASYTIFQNLFDANTTSTTPAAAGGGLYDGIEEIMPLARAAIERNNKEPPSAPLTERSIITSLVKPRSKEPRKIVHSKSNSQQHINMDWFDNSDSKLPKPTTGSDRNYQYHQHFGLAWFDDSNAATNKMGATTESVKRKHQLQQNYPAAFDEALTLPSISAEKVDVTLRPHSPKFHPHFHRGVDERLTVGHKKVEMTARPIAEVTKKFSLSVGDVWHWMLDDKMTARRSNASAETTTFTPISNSTSTSTTTQPTTSTSTISPTTTPKFVCPENDTPTNIGPYEVPTEKDLVLFTKKILMNMFDNYHRRTFQFLRDIKEASKAAIVDDKNCKDLRRIVYRQCLREVSSHYEQHIKKLVNSLESDRHAIKGMTEGSVCNLNEMKKDPVLLIKTLAVEEVSLQFALPGFLRLISSCRRFCNTPQPKKPNAEDLKESKLKENLQREAMLKYMLTRNEYNSGNQFRRNRQNLVARQKSPNIKK